MTRKLVLYIAMSLDGYIAKHDGNLDFLNIVNTPGEDFGYANFLNTVDTVIWGRKTFDKVLSFGIAIPHTDKQLFVVSKTRTGAHEHAIYNNNVIELVKQLKSEEGKDIYCDGGAEIIAQLLKHQLIDRIIVSVIPHLLGSGIRLFSDNLTEQSLKFNYSISFPCGLVQLHYERTAE
jgi:dihydrofolate reductase